MDILNQEWYLITTGQFGYPQPEDDYLDLTYNMSSACRTCGIGKHQINEFRFRAEPKAKHSQFLGLNWVFDQIFVREPVKMILERENISSVNFTQPVIHKSGKPIEGIYQMHVDTYLTHGLLTENLKTETCEMPRDKSRIKSLMATKSNLLKGPFCGHQKYNYPQGDNQLTIKAEALQSKPDILRLNDWFGSGGSANQPIIISKKLREIIKSEKWRGLYFNHITLT